MARCPKCGTSVDETSTQCHMCGTSFEGIELEKTYKDDGFADNFFAQIGGVVSSEQDTILNNTEMNVNATDISNANAIEHNSVFVANENTSANEQYNSVVSEITNFNAVNDTKVYKNNNNSDDEDEMLSEIKFKLDREESSDVIIEKINEERMKENFEDFSAIKPANVQVSKSFIFNTACFVIFVLMMAFVYFKFIRTPGSKVTELGGLSYKINSDFTLTSDNSGSKYYSYNGEDCALRVTYGSASSDGFLSSYFETVREGFKEEDRYSFQNEEIKIHNNTWSGLSVMEFYENANANGGYETLLKYKYASIVYNGNFYHIVFVNVNSDNTCNTMFNEFMGTLNFN